MGIELLLAAVLVQADVPPVPGLCTAPVPSDPDTPGCYRTNEIELLEPPAVLYWHIREYTDQQTANAEAARHRWAAVAQAHAKIWLYVLGEKTELVTGGVEKAVVGPISVPNGVLTAHFAESIFPPGMRTRVHSHPGPEAFYVVEGEQCMESPNDRRKIEAGGTYIVASGLHVQAAPEGRRNLVLIIAPQGEPSVNSRPAQWSPSDFCS